MQVVVNNIKSKDRFIHEQALLLKEKWEARDKKKYSKKKNKSA